MIVDIKHDSTYTLTKQGQTVMLNLDDLAVLVGQLVNHGDLTVIDADVDTTYGTNITVSLDHGIIKLFVGLDPHDS